MTGVTSTNQTIIRGGAEIPPGDEQKKCPPTLPHWIRRGRSNSLLKPDRELLIVRTNTFKVWILWDGNELEARALEAEGGVLSGMSLLYGYRFTMDVLVGGAVTISPLRELAIST